MKNMKKLWAALRALGMTFSLAACGGTSDEESTKTSDSDVAYVQDKGTLVVGITEV